MSLSTKAGVLTLIKSMNEEESFHLSFFSFSSYITSSAGRIFSLDPVIAFYLSHIVNFCFCFTSAPPAPRSNLQALKRHLKSCNNNACPSLTINSNSKSLIPHLGDPFSSHSFYVCIVILQVAPQHSLMQCSTVSECLCSDPLEEPEAFLPVLLGGCGGTHRLRGVLLAGRGGLGDDGLGQTLRGVAYLPCADDLSLLQAKVVLHTGERGRREGVRGVMMCY